MKLDALKSYIQTGREIEFSYHGEMYSITYTFDSSGQTINFCHFFHHSVDYCSFDEFFEAATVGSELLRDVLDRIEDIVVY